MSSVLGQFVPTARVPQAYTSGPVTALRVQNGSAYDLRVILGGQFFDKVDAGADRTYALANASGYAGWVLLIPGPAPITTRPGLVQLAGPVTVTSYGGGDVIPYGTQTQLADGAYQPFYAQPDPLLDSVRGALRLNVRMFGAQGDGVTDDSAAIAACVSALKVCGGGVAYFPLGVYLWTPATTLDVHATNGILLQGDMGGVFDVGTAGGAAASGVPSCELRYTASGSQTFINAQQHMGFALEGLAVRYSSASYTGRLIDAGSAGAVNPSVGLVIRNALLSGTTSSANGATLLYLDGAVDVLCEASTFGFAVSAVVGRDPSAGAGFSNAVEFVRCRFVRCTNAVLNPYLQWSFHGCTFEINASNNPVTVKSQDGTRACYGLAFHGCGFWDAGSANSGFFVDVFGAGTGFFGCYVDVLGAGSGLVRINTDGNLGSFDGLALHDTTFTGGSGTILTITGSGAFTNLDVGTLANLGALVDPSGTANLPSGNIGFAPVRSSLAFSSYSASGAVNLRRDSVQAITLTANITPTFPTVPSGIAHKLRLELIQGGAGSFTVSWPGSVNWGAVGAPTLTTTAGKVDIVEFVSRDGGATWRGVLIGKGF